MELDFATGVWISANGIALRVVGGEEIPVAEGGGEVRAGMLRSGVFASPPSACALLMELFGEHILFVFAPEPETGLCGLTGPDLVESLCLAFASAWAESALEEPLPCPDPLPCVCLWIESSLCSNKLNSIAKLCIIASLATMSTSPQKTCPPRESGASLCLPSFTW